MKIKDLIKAGQQSLTKLKWWERKQPKVVPVSKVEPAPVQVPAQVEPIRVETVPAPKPSAAEVLNRLILKGTAPRRVTRRQGPIGIQEIPGWSGISTVRLNPLLERVPRPIPKVITYGQVKRARKLKKKQGRLAGIAQRRAAKQAVKQEIKAFFKILKQVADDPKDAA